MPGVSTEELERNNALAHQLNDFASFEREKTRVDTGTASLRVSPLQGISVAEYVTSTTALQDRLGFASGYLIKACAATGKESGCLPLRELWNLSGGPPGKTHSAQSMIDLLMRAPLVAVRVGVGESFDSSWVIMAKEANTNYKQLATMMSRIQTPSASHSIAKERLRTLTRMASSAADRRLIELAALDQASARKARQLSGRKSESAEAQRERERAMRTAVETMKAYEELARIDTISEISALLGDEITDVDLRAEIAKLKSHEEAIEREEEDSMLTESFVPRDAQYDVETVDGELDLETDFQAVLDACSVSEADELAERLTAAAQKAGITIDLDFESIRDPAQQEELVQLFGEGWGEALSSCLAEPLVPPLAEDSSDGEDDLDYYDGEQYQKRLEDHIEELVLSVKRELGVQPSPDEPAEGDSSKELMILSQFTPAQLVTKLLARNHRKRQRQAERSEEMADARRSLTGQNGTGKSIGARRLDTVLGKWPDVGDKIEAICADLKVGADASRRDGAITLNSAVARRKGSVGFTRIRLELQARHGIELSARALRELCVTGKRRLHASARYKGVVNLKLRRSVKRIGQDNLDDHSQNATYRLLHFIRDRTSYDDTLWFARDDHAMVRGNSSESTRQHATVTTTGEGASALKYDYMNPEISSSLYASSYLVSGCADGGDERCLATTKAVKLAPSTPTQHYADFYMLQKRAETDPLLKSIFFTPQGAVKPKVQLEVDGGSDENPTGRETRFLQTELLMGGPFLDVTQRRTQVGAMTREAGASSLNKVERLNGEETQAATGFHAIANDEQVGPLHDEATGQYDQSQLEAMWLKHAEDYRKQLDGKCGLNGSDLMAFPGATAASCAEAKALLERRPKLLLLLDPTTSKKKLAAAEASDPVLVAHVKKVRTMQEHVEMLTHYSSCVRCCSNTACKLCCDAPSISCWWDGGPLLRPVPPALRDPDRSGHYFEPEPALIKYASLQYKLSEWERKSPSDIALGIYEREMGKSLQHFPDSKLAAAAKEINDYRITADVLRKHFVKLRYIRLRRLEGARKAAETRKKNQGARTQAAARAAPSQSQPTMPAMAAAAAEKTAEASAGAEAKAKAEAEAKAKAEAEAAKVAAEAQAQAGAEAEAEATADAEAEAKAKAKAEAEAEAKAKAKAAAKAKKAEEGAAEAKKVAAESAAAAVAEAEAVKRKASEIICIRCHTSMPLEQIVAATHCCVSSEECKARQEFGGRGARGKLPRKK